MSALDALRSQHTSQGKCGCCWNQTDKDHPNNSRTICSCGQHEPCDTARLLDDALAEVEKLRATIERARMFIDKQVAVSEQHLNDAITEAERRTTTSKEHTTP